MMNKKYKVAAVQTGPVFLDIEKTIDKVCGFIKEAAGSGAKVIGFPEALLPGYPWWVWLGDGDSYAPYYAQLLENSVTEGDAHMAKLSECAKVNDIYVCVSGHERVDDSVFMTQFWFDNHGNLIGKHRKMKATAAERRAWMDGDGSTNVVYDTPLGKIGSLMCAEHHVPAYHAIVGAQGEQLHVASYPPLPVERHGTMGLKAPLNAVKSLCIENKAFAMFCTQVITDDTLEKLFSDNPELVEKMPTTISGFGGRGGGAACVINPRGEIISGDFLDPCAEGIVYGEVDLAECTAGKMLYDVYGNSKKAGVLKVFLNRETQLPINFVGKQADNSVSYEQLRKANMK